MTMDEDNFLVVQFMATAGKLPMASTSRRNWMAQLGPDHNLQPVLVWAQQLTRNGHVEAQRGAQNPSGKRTREDGSWCDTDEAGHASPGTKASLAVRLEPGRKPKNTSWKASRLPTVGAPGHSRSRDLRTVRPHETQSTEHLDAQPEIKDSVPCRTGGTAVPRRVRERQKTPECSLQSIVQVVDNTRKRARRSFQRNCSPANRLVEALSPG